MIGNEKEAHILRGYAKRLDPNDSGAFNNLGVVFYNKGFYDDARGAFETALEIDPQNSLARRNLRLSLQKSGELSQFINDKKDLLSQNPDDWQTLVELAQFYKKIGEYEKAANTFEQALRRKPDYQEAHVHLAEIYSRLGQYSDTIRECLISLQIFPTNASLHLSLGQAYYNSGMDDAAIEELRKAIELEPDSAEAHFFLGFVYGDKGLYDKALEESRKATELNPNYGKVRSNLAIAHASENEVIAVDEKVDVEDTTFSKHYTLGTAYFNRGLLKEAHNEFEMALDADRDARLIYKNLGEIDLLLGNRKESLNNYLKASIVEPYSSKISNDMGVIYHLDGNYLHAFQHYQKALKVDRQYAAARNNLAVLLYQIGSEEEALSLFSLIPYQNDTRQYEAYYNYGVALSRQSSFEDAITNLKRARELNNSSTLVHRSLGVVYHDFGDNDAALEEFHKVLELNPKDALSYYFMAIVLNSLKRYQEAIEATKKGSELGPFNAEYNFLLAIESTTKRENNMIVPSKVLMENREDQLQIQKWMSDDSLANTWESIKTANGTSMDGHADTMTDSATEVDSEDYESELEHLESRYQEDPTNTQVISKLGEMYLNGGNVDRALNILVNAAENDPVAQRNLGIILVKKHKYIEAIQSFQKSALARNDDYRVYIAIGILHEEIGLIDNALRAYQTAANLKDKCVTALRKIGKIYLSRGDLDQAKLAFKELIKATPDDSEAYRSLGEIFFKSGRYEQAIRVYTLLQRRKNNQLDVQYYLALCNYGRIFRRAIEDWKKTIQSAKTDTEKKYARERLAEAREQERKLQLRLEVTHVY